MPAATATVAVVVSLEVAVYGTTPPDAVTVRGAPNGDVKVIVVGTTANALKLTVTLTTSDPPCPSAIVTVQLPAATGATSKTAGPGPEALDGVTVATPVFELTAVNVPANPVSDTTMPASD